MAVIPLLKLIDASHSLEALAKSGSSLWAWAKANCVSPRSLRL
jgi:hypothetical protein